MEEWNQLLWIRYRYKSRKLASLVSGVHEYAFQLHVDVATLWCLMSVSTLQLADSMGVDEMQLKVSTHAP